MTTTPSSKEVFIMGLTSEGRKFRPSDWAERLAGVMSHFRPGGASHPGAHLSYSPLVYAQHRRRYQVRDR